MQVISTRHASAQGFERSLSARARVLERSSSVCSPDTKAPILDDLWTLELRLLEPDFAARMKLHKYV